MTGSALPPLNRRELLCSGACAGLALVGRPRRRPVRRPNVLFLHTDQQSAPTVSALGAAHLLTPNIDRLVARGTAFRESYCADPVCMPARAAWYTGRPPVETGVLKNGLPLRAGVPDLGAWLRRAGYATFHAGKWHLLGREAEQSFEVLVGKTIYGENGDGVVSSAAAAFLRNYRDERPFFLNVGLLQPHDINYWLQNYERQGCPLPGYLDDDELPPAPRNLEFDFEEPESFRERRTQKGARMTAGWSERHWRTYLWTYYRHVEMVDAEIGRVLDALSESGREAETLVLFSSDHGDGMGGHGLVSKGMLYEEAVKVPLVLAWPGQVPAGRIEERLVTGLDLFPTICDYAGVEPPPLLRGRSLRPLFSGPAPEWRTEIVASCNITGRMIRTQRYKLITYAGDEVQLFFDLESDPAELANLAREADLEAERERHLAALEAWEAELDPAPEPPEGWEAARDTRER